MIYIFTRSGIVAVEGGAAAYLAIRNAGAQIARGDRPRARPELGRVAEQAL